VYFVPSFFCSPVFKETTCPVQPLLVFIPKKLLYFKANKLFPLPDSTYAAERIVSGNILEPAAAFSASALY
jgi:hypothetical protein